VKTRTPLTRRERRLMAALRTLFSAYCVRFSVGQQMANVCWNGARKLLLERDQPLLKELAEKWDGLPHDAERAARKLLEKKP
jgi:hypothetical protein